jgi:hypothetical protein
MSLSGNLKTMSLPDLLQWLHGSLKTGILEVRQGPHAKKIEFCEGEIWSSSSNDPTEYLGQFLLSHHIISEEELQHGMETQAETGVMLGKILLAQGKLSEKDLKRYLSLKAEETIFSLFLWEDARFEFQEGPVGGDRFVPFRLSISDVLLKGLSRYDELLHIKKVFGTFATVVGRTATLPGPEFLSDPRRSAIWGRIDGQRSISDIALELHTSEFLACEAIHLLLQMKHVQIVRRVSFAELDDGVVSKVDDPVAEARRQMLQGNPEQALAVVDSASREVQAAELVDLRQQAQKAFLERAYQEDLPLEAVPYLLRPVESLTHEDLNPQEGFLLTRINGTWDIRAVMTVAPFSEVEVVRSLRSLRAREIIGMR